MSHGNQHSYYAPLFGLREIEKREIEKREKEEKLETSPVW
jgi:hypothetical protein